VMTHIILIVGKITFIFPLQISVSP